LFLFVVRRAQRSRHIRKALEDVRDARVPSAVVLESEAAAWLDSMVPRRTAERA
jgi:hypothetical protein